MTRIKDERLAEMREWVERDRTRWPVGDLLAEVDYHRAKDAELHRLAMEVGKCGRVGERFMALEGLWDAILDECGPS